MAEDDRWLLSAWAQALAAQAADLHLASGQMPLMRCRGQLVPLTSGSPCPPLPWPGLAAYFSDASAQRLLQGQTAGEAEGAFEHPALGRARWSLARTDHGLMLVMRLIRGQVPSLLDVQLDTTVANRLLPAQGLVLITGATGSGKSSTLAALVEHRRHAQGGHVITLEDPIEFRYDSHQDQGRISQREIGRDSLSFASALRAALRQDPDVLLIGELRDAETARLALSAAETGHLVLTTLHTASAVGAIDRLLSLFPPDEQELAQALLAETLVGVLAQELIWQDGQARALREVLIATSAVRHLIREHRLAQIHSVMQTGGSLGMQTRAQAWERGGFS
ncbi:type IV pilus twitching motility protein PilT [Perlucidibaca aquatica]|uniref:type IV pilus twitching motility protein PilT n=1 Tax=Perlucidibaca aquatica TaxID=1852776 RepID=UPI00083ACD7E|nr:ATPase, T2SS/T4P/T4SS family [Perlucidibaca aquatica]